MTFLGCALAPGAAQVPQRHPPPRSLHRGGVGGESVAGHPWGEGRACASWWKAGHAGGTLGSPSLGDGCLRGRVFTGVERWVCAPVHADRGIQEPEV